MTMSDAPLQEPGPAGSFAVDDDEANHGRDLAEAGAAADKMPQNIPDLGNPELSAPPDGLHDAVAAAESDA